MHRPALPTTVGHRGWNLFTRRAFSLTPGHKDLIAHIGLRQIPHLALLLGNGDFNGADRLRLRDNGKP
jgi:hypothetical protein